MSVAIKSQLANVANFNHKYKMGNNVLYLIYYNRLQSGVNGRGEDRRYWKVIGKLVHSI